MERIVVDKLTELNIDIDTVDSLPSLYGLQDFEEEAITNVVKSLREYVNLEEQGLLLRLPCKVGDIVYKICPQSKYIEFGQMWDGKIVEHPCQKCPWKCCDCKDIGFQKDMDNIVQKVVAMNEIWIIAREQYFGSIYFLTQEEAENKLKELQSK